MKSFKIGELTASLLLYLTTQKNHIFQKIKPNTDIHTLALPLTNGFTVVITFTGLIIIDCRPFHKAETAGEGLLMTHTHGHPLPAHTVIRNETLFRTPRLLSCKLQPPLYHIHT